MIRYFEVSFKIACAQDAAGQLRQSPHQFSGVSAMSPLLWLARRYAILVREFAPLMRCGLRTAGTRYLLRAPGNLSRH